MYLLLGVLFVALLPIVLAVVLVRLGWQHLPGSHQGSDEVNPPAEVVLPTAEDPAPGAREPMSEEGFGLAVYIGGGFWAWVFGSIVAHYLLQDAHGLDHGERTIATILIFVAFIPWAVATNRLIPKTALRAVAGGVSRTKTGIALAGVIAYWCLTAAVPVIVAVILRK